MTHVHVAQKQVRETPINRREKKAPPTYSIPLISANSGFHLRKRKDVSFEREKIYGDTSALKFYTTSRPSSFLQNTKTYALGNAATIST